MTRPLDRAALLALLHVEVRTPLRSLQGRETFLHRTAEGREIVVKRSRPGARPGARREHEALERLAADGIPVPAALGWTAGADGSVLAIERVEHRETARSALAVAAPALRRALLARVARLVAELHARGWHHRDLYLQHVLVRAQDGALVLIDAGRARRRRLARSRWFVKDLAAALHSMPAAVGARERLEFLARYLDARGIRSRARRRRWIGAARRKQRRLAAHLPRDEGGEARS